MLEIQKDLRSKLAQAFPEIDVNVKVSSHRKCPQIVVFREGGREVNPLLDRPGIGIYVWDETESKTEKLAMKVSNVMRSLSFEDGYCSMVQETMFSAQDPDTREPRWYLSYTITTYEPKG